jgi:hypothetical protein
MMKNISFTVIVIFVISHLGMAQCFDNRHNTGIDNAWLSCEASPNPNVVRGMSHWIMYDLGEPYSLEETAYWGFNDPERLSNNIREIVIDYSLDGLNWTEWGTYTLEQAPGSTLYLGDEGPDLTGITTQYLLITAIDNYGGDCYGMSEIRFNVGDLISSSEDLITDLEEIVAFPNPTSGLTGLQFTSLVDSDGSIIISDLSGKNLMNRKIILRKGIINHSIDLSDYQSGNYVISVKTENQIVSTEVTLIK